LALAAVALILVDVIVGTRGRNGLVEEPEPAADEEPESRDDPDGTSGESEEPPNGSKD
jgi:hypothetical protein